MEYVQGLLDVVMSLIDEVQCELEGVDVDGVDEDLLDDEGFVHFDEDGLILHPDDLEFDEDGFGWYDAD